MSTRVAQDRFPVGFYWFVALGWPIVTWLWSLLPDSNIDRDELPAHFIIGGLLAIGALYATFNRWRFPASTLVIESPPAPGQRFRARIETPFKNESSPHIKLRLEANDGSKRNSPTVWLVEGIAPVMRGERRLIARIDLAIPAEVAKVGRLLRWRLDARTGLYHAHFVIGGGAQSAPTE
jgi:hypothetical protein